MRSTPIPQALNWACRWTTASRPRASARRCLVMRGDGGADQALGLVVARGGKIGQQGFVEIVLHVAQRDGWPLGKRFCQRKRLVLKFCVGHDAVDQPDRLASPCLDLLGGE